MVNTCGGRTPGIQRTFTPPMGWIVVREHGGIATIRPSREMMKARSIKD